MKPFNLEAAKRGEPVIQRCGRLARILAFDSQVKFLEQQIPLVVEFLNEEGEWVVKNYTSKGSRALSDGGDSDLFMAPRKERRWIVSGLDEDDCLHTTGCNNQNAVFACKSDYAKYRYTNIQVTEIEVEP